jgi:hypothetical protein
LTFWNYKLDGFALTVEDNGEGMLADIFSAAKELFA